MNNIDIKKEVADSLINIATSIEKKSPLSIMVALKKINNIVDKLKEAVLVDANKEYLKLKEANPLVKTIVFEDAILSKYTPKAVYEYPPHIVELELKLKAMKKEAEINGTAKRVEVKQGENVTIFSIKVS